MSCHVWYIINLLLIDRFMGVWSTTVGLYFHSIFLSFCLYMSLSLYFWLFHTFLCQSYVLAVSPSTYRLIDIHLTLLFDQPFHPSIIVWLTFIWPYSLFNHSMQIQRKDDDGICGPVGVEFGVVLRWRWRGPGRYEPTFRRRVAPRRMRRRQGGPCTIISMYGRTDHYQDLITLYLTDGSRGKQNLTRW